MNSKPSFSLAGSWVVSSTQTGIIPFYSQINLGVSKANGLVLAGWAYNGFSSTVFYTTNIAILDQNADGTLKVATGNYISDPVINGTGSVIVSDFNKDGVDDIFLTAHNESPFIPKPSTVYLSTGIDSFNKLILVDSVMAHSAILSIFNGLPTIVTAGYGNEFDPYYQFNPTSNSFTIGQWGNSSLGVLLGSSAITGDFLGDGKSQLVVVDTKPLNNYVPGDSQIVLYGLNGNALDLNSVHVLPSPYFVNNPSYPGASSHMYRVWTEDFNHDNALDLMIAESTAGGIPQQASKIQMLQNQGGFAFKDMTDALGSAYATTTNNVDYQTQFVDLDNSGINSYLLGDSPLGAGTTQSNYLLLNDGTGKLYAALHDEFVTWGNSVKSYLNLPSWFTGIPKFIGYQLADGAINYLAVVFTGNGVTIPLVNVPVHYNITTDFTQNITIADRNQSMLMRTWAGNDTFYDTNANSAAAHLDGGLGRDISTYSGSVAQYQIKTLANQTFEVKLTATSSVAPKVDDTLTNIERLQFTDTTIALDTSATQTAGSGYMLYKAAFNRTPDVGGLGFWINKMDGNMSFNTVAQNFVNSAEFKTAYGGSNPSVNTLVTKLYNNVLIRNPDGGGLAFWQDKLTTGGWTVANVLGYFATSAENVTNVTPLIANGIPYTEFVG